MSAITIGSGGGGGGGTPAVPRSDESSGWGVRVWPHNNMPDLATVYTPSVVYPDNSELVPLNVGRVFQFAANPTQEIGPDFPMEFATAAEAANADPSLLDRSVMKFTGAVKAKVKFCIGIAQTDIDSGVALSLMRVQAGDDDLVLLKVDTSAQRALGESGEIVPDNVPSNYQRSRHVILETPWILFEEDDLVYLFWDTESVSGRMIHTYCQAEYYV